MDSAVQPARTLCPVKGELGVASFSALTPGRGLTGHWSYICGFTGHRHSCVPLALWAAEGSLVSQAPTRPSALTTKGEHLRWQENFYRSGVDQPWGWALIVKRCTCGTLMRPAHSSPRERGEREREMSMGSARPSAPSAGPEGWLSPYWAPSTEMMTTALYTVYIWLHVHLKSQAVPELTLSMCIASH